MSILRAAAKLIIRESRNIACRDPALTLGVPEVHATADDVVRWIPEYAGRACALDSQSFGRTSNPIGARLNWIDGCSFLKALGINVIESLDIPGSEHPPEIEHDLNNPVPLSMHQRYGFILDPGTLEHVFDIRTCLVNIAQSLAVGGTVVHLVPVYSYNGGYYSINPNVLHDFYRLNGFAQIRAYLIMWDRYHAYSKRKTRCYEYKESVLGSRHALADRDQVRFTPHLLLFATKERDIASPVSPLQFGGHYAAEASALSASRARRLERFGKKWAPLVNRVLPFTWAQFVQSIVYRNLVLSRSRREAGFWI